MRFIVFLIRISALPGWRVYALILSQQKFKIVRALYTKMDGSGVTCMYSIRTQNVYFHYNVQEQILKLTETVLQIRRKMSSSYEPSEPQITEPLSFN